MSEFCLALLTNLLRTTAFLSVTAIVVGVVLKLSRCQSPRVHRVAWCLVLVQGLVFVRVPWSIHSTRQPTPLTVQTEMIPSNGEPLSLPSDTGIEFAPAMPDATIAFTPPIAQPPMQLGIAEIVSRHWAEWAALAWFGGIVMLVGTWIFRHTRFLRTLPLGDPVPEAWQQEFIGAFGMNDRQPPLELRITDDAGPLLCRRFSGYVLLVPKLLWNSLGAQERQAILRHEIGHYRRGDLWKSIGVRALALPHWFNPFAWLAVRRFDEAAEWACDQLAAGGEVPATDFANTLLKVCESTKSYGVMVPAARGSSVTRRIRRLLIIPKEDSIMRKFIVCSTASLLLMAGGMQIRLVAEDSPAPIPNTKTAAAPGIESITIDQAKAMVTAAEKAYEFSMNPPMDSSVNFEQAYTWSRRWLQAAVDAAGNAEERQRAYREHRDRMKSVLDFVQERVSIGFRGFDSYQLAAAQFYLAEANLWLAQQESKAVRASEKPVVFNANASQHVEVYPIHNADPDLVVKVVQSALAGAPDVRLAVDAINNSIVAQARPSEHAKIRELVNKLDVKPRELVVKSATGDGVKPAAPGLEMVTRTAPGMPASTRVTYEVKSPAELIKILQPLLAGQSRVEMKSLGNNSQLIVSAPAEQQDAIRALVTHLEPPAKDVVRLIEPQKRIVAKFTNVDVDTAQKMLPQIAPADSNYEVIYDFHDKSLVVKAPPVKNGERNLEPGDLRRDEEPSEQK